LTSLLEVKKSLSEVLLKREDVIGVGVDNDKQTIRVYVNNEDLKEELPPIPSMMSGYPIELIPVPGFMPLGFRSSRYRPVVGGVSASHPSVTAGTIGAVITDRMSGNKLLLSNNHVFANADSVESPKASEGDPILQPGVVDGGDMDDVVATLYRWVPFTDKGLNLVDAALALPLDQSMASPYILMDGNNDLLQIHGIKSVTSPINVKKYGRTTGMDRGKVLDWDFDVSVDYEDGTTRNFTDQILAEIETQGGDSGSLLLDDNNNAVGLVFAGGVDKSGHWFGVANKIRNVLAMFGGDVDISDGWVDNTKTEPKPALIIQEKSVNAMVATGNATPFVTILIAGAGLVGAALVWKHLNTGER
jgi:hypothetical protein